LNKSWKYIDDRRKDDNVNYDTELFEYNKELFETAPNECESEGRCVSNFGRKE
jgi:hypothetical protein